jgi:mono/diheme cytochrome c family protein
MPAHEFDLQSYIRFLFRSARDDRFNANTLIPAIEQANPDFSFIDSIIYRFLLIPRTKDALVETADTFVWMDNRPNSGPGAVDTFNPFNQFFGFSPGSDNTVGTADLPSIWDQRIRIPMELHWDGNNRSVDERNINAAIGAGGIVGMQESIDLEGIAKVAEWALDLPAPDFPADRIDAQKAEEGRAVYDTYCARCHSIDGNMIGQVTPIWEVGTDPERLRSFTPQLATMLNRTGEGQPWAYSHFRKTDGYSNMLLDGIWLRAPYFHNGSVPTLRDLLNPPNERPQAFYRGYNVYDYDNVGFVSSGPEAESTGILHDTRVRGKSNQGHEYGTQLIDQQKDALIEYLKTE